MLLEKNKPWWTFTLPGPRRHHRRWCTHQCPSCTCRPAGSYMGYHSNAHHRTTPWQHNPLLTGSSCLVVHDTSSHTTDTERQVKVWKNLFFSSSQELLAVLVWKTLEETLDVLSSFFLTESQISRLTRGFPSDQRKSPSMVLSLRPVHWYSLYLSKEKEKHKNAKEPAYTISKTQHRLQFQFNTRMHHIDVHRTF